MIGMHFGWRERLKNSRRRWDRFSPTVAKCWYFVAKEENLPEILLGGASIFGTRLRTARSIIKFHHHRELRESGVHADGEIQSANAALLQEARRRMARGLPDCLPMFF